MNKKQAILLLTLIFLITPSLFAVFTPEQTKEARKTWLKGYEYFEKAEQALKSGQLRDAHTLLDESIDIFNEIKTKYPGWSSSMIEYRLKLCRQKNAEVEKLLSDKNIKLTNEDVDKENLNLKSELKKLKQELELSKRKLTITLTSLEEARREAARNTNSASDVEKIIKEKTELEKKYALLQDRMKNIETQPLPVPDQQEGNKALDSALLKIESLSKENKTLRDGLGKEKVRFEKLANDNIQLKYKNKLLLEKDEATQKVIDKLNSKLAEHNEIIARWEKEKEKLKNENLDLQNELQAAKAEAKEAADKLDEVRMNKGDDIIIKQLKNENELLSKDLDLVHLNLAKELKAKKELIEAKKELEERLKRVENSLTEAVQEKSQSASDLEMFKKKLLVNDTIIKKQDMALQKQKEENAKLSEELKALANKYKNIDKKEREFTELAKESLRVENQNRELKRQLADTKSKLGKMNAAMKQSEVKAVQMQKDLQDLISQNSEMEKQNLIATDKLKEKLADLKKLNAQYSEKLSTNEKKITMLTEELVTVNTMVEKKDQEIAELSKKCDELKKLKEKESHVAEPAVATNSIKVETLTKENAKLLNEIAQKDKIILSLKEEHKKKPTSETKAVTASKPAIDPTQLEKMLKSAFHAEESGKKEAASWYYEKVLAVDPYNNTALTRLSHIEAENGNYDDAIELLEKGLKNDPDDVEKLQILTVCYIRKNQFYKALGAAAKANAIAPKDPKTQRYLGIICSNLGWKKAAEDLFRESFKLDPTSADTAFNAAVLLASEKDRLKEAKLWYDKAISLGSERDPGIEKVLKEAK